MKTDRMSISVLHKVEIRAEIEGFEPPVGEAPTTAFQAVAFNRTQPYLRTPYWTRTSATAVSRQCSTAKLKGSVSTSSPRINPGLPVHL